MKKRGKDKPRPAVRLYQELEEPLVLDLIFGHQLRVQKIVDETDNKVFYNVRKWVFAGKDENGVARWRPDPRKGISLDEKTAAVVAEWILNEEAKNDPEGA